MANEPVSSAATPSSLANIPAISPRYVPTYVSPDSNTKLRDPKQFCIKPPFWRRWPAARYTRLANHLRENFDPVPFAEQEHLTVEEVQHVFNAVVTEPLSDEAEKICGVAEKRMVRVFQAMNDRGVQMRVWSGGLRGEFVGVRPGVVQLVGEVGEMLEARFEDLSKENKQYVLGLVGEEEMAKLERDDIE